MNIKKTATFNEKERPLVLNYMLQWYDDSARKVRIVNEFAKTKEFEVVEVTENNQSQDGIEITYGDKSWEYGLFSLNSIRRYILLGGKPIENYKVT